MRTLTRHRHHRSLPRRQRGLVLFIALIVLVAMTMAGIGMVRSIDTGTMVAGNLSFKQTAVNSSEAGLQEAYDWLVDNAGGGGLSNSDTAHGYYSSRPANDPDWTDPETWEDAVVLDEDATGNTVSYLIHRMCTEANTPYNGSNAGVVNQCAMSASTSTPSAGGSMSVGSYSFAGTPQVYYRITVRTQGPRNTESYVQAMVALSN